MPIPWLIGAAVVAVVAAVASSVSEDAEKERQEKERQARDRAAKEEARTNAEAEARRERAKREEEWRQEQERIHDLERFSYEKANVLVKKYAVQDISLDEIADLAVCNPRKCEDVFNKAFVHSAKYQNMDNEKNLLIKKTQEIEYLSNLIANFG